MSRTVVAAVVAAVLVVVGAVAAAVVVFSGDDSSDAASQTSTGAREMTIRLLASVTRANPVDLPPRNVHVLDIDMWIDFVLASDPALLMGFGLTIAVGLIYLLVFHITLGRTLGMRVLGIKVIDVYGDAPSPARCVARCAGYVAGVATLFLGFLWIGFDAEKRGLQDWIAGTYVIKAA